MVRVIDPAKSSKGPGMAFEGKSWAKKKKTKHRAHIPVHSGSLSGDKPAPSDKPSNDKQFIGQELLEWHGPKDQTGKTSETSGNEQTTAARDSVIGAFEAPLASSRHALCFDTRFLNTSSVDDIGNHLCARYHDFSRTLVDRGAGPCLMSKTDPGGKKRSSINILTFDLDDQSTREKVYGSKLFLLKALPIDPSHKAGQGDGTLSVPKALSAKCSWKIISGMIDSLVSVDKEKQDKSQCSGLAPLQITVLTSDLSLFCDTNQDSHKTGIVAFRDVVAPFFQDGSLSEIRIVVAKTGKLALVGDAGKQHDLDPVSNDEDIEMRISSERHEHVQAVARCMTAMQAALVECSIGVTTCTLSSVSITMIDHSLVGYKALSRQLLRDVVLGQRLRGRLQLELPELLDGTQCSVTFDATYQTLPFAANAQETSGLWNDLQHLSQSKLQVTQIIPFASVDARLLYGVPITVCPGLEDNIGRSQEMELLVRSLFRVLRDRGIALLLTCEDDSKSMADTGLFLGSPSANGFLLMAQELHKSDEHMPPHTGLIFLYARADQLLQETTSCGESPLVDTEMESQYANYIEQAMDYLEVKSDNPLDPSWLEKDSASAARRRLHKSVPRQGRSVKGDRTFGSAHCEEGSAAMEE